MAAMNRSVIAENTAFQRAADDGLRSGSSIEDELAEIAEELAAARDLHATYDPDSPPWSAEADLRRLELRLALLITDEPHRRPPRGGATSHREGRKLLSAA
jgi:hypothetical protein